MFESFMTWLNVVLSTLGLMADPASLGGITGTIALTLAVLAATVVLVAVAGMSPGALDTRAGPHPRRAIDISAPLTASDPDAPGHPRPRAPQFVASAT